MNEQVKVLSERLQEGVKEIFNSQAYMDYLKFQSKFTKYSVNNTILIRMQRPDASYVAGFESWKKNFNRHVVKGAKSIKIFAPMKFKKEIKTINEDGCETTKTVEGLTFRVISVFDAADTEGEELPQLIKDIECDADFENFLEKVKKISEFPIQQMDLKDGLDGYFDKKQIVINENMSNGQKVAALFHELTHSILHKDAKGDRREKEVQAESVAYIVCNYYGIETSENSFPYIAEWSGSQDSESLIKSLDVIQKTAADIISKIDNM